MKHIIEHLVDKHDRGPSLRVVDEPGAGGAHHHYVIGDFDDLPLPETVYMNAVELHFQNGTVPDNGVNGVTQEVLLAIVIDRLRSFQAGPYACGENALALRCCESALEYLKTRTMKRRQRGVEGKQSI